MEKRMSIWFDREGDFMEFGIDPNRKGFFRDLGNDVFERVDAKGNILGFAVFNFTKRSLVDQKIKLPVKLKMIPAR